MDFQLQRRVQGGSSLELLAPAGSWSHFHAAVNAGADAVYVGVEGFNMRANASNFQPADLSLLANEAHASGVKLYLALNILCFESDLDELEVLLNIVASSGIDAVIAADFAVIEMCRERGIEVHISTQLSIANSRALGFWFEQGLRRFVLARECSLEAITEMKARLASRYGERAQELEIEAFVHGAMCVSMSGRCFMSAHQCGKSANRGECTQPCRREYVVMEKNGKEAFRIDGGHILSPKDLCALPFIEALIDGGVYSFKIEGRNRSADYVSTVVGAYRQCIDFYLKNQNRDDFDSSFSALKESCMEELATVYNRGFSEGFYFGRPMGDWTTPPGNQATEKRKYLGKVLNYYDRVGVAEVVVESGALKLGDQVFFEGIKTGVLQQSVETLEIDKKRIDTASKGMCVGMKTSGAVRKHDKLYLRDAVA